MPWAEDLADVKRRDFAAKPSVVTMAYGADLRHLIRRNGWRRARRRWRAEADAKLAAEEERRIEAENNSSG